MHPVAAYFHAIFAAGRRPRDRMNFHLVRVVARFRHVDIGFVGHGHSVRPRESVGSHGRAAQPPGIRASAGGGPETPVTLWPSTCLAKRVRSVRVPSLARERMVWRDASTARGMLARM